MKYYSVETNTIEEVKITKEKSILFDSDGFMYTYTVKYPNGHISYNLREQVINNYFFRSKKLAIKKLNQLINSRICFHKKEIDILRKYIIK